MQAPANSQLATNGECQRAKFEHRRFRDIEAIHRLAILEDTAVDDQRFDQMTRGLAGRMRRRDALTGLGVGIGAIAALLQGKDASAQSLTVVGQALCGLAIFGCQTAQLVGPNYSNSVSPDGYNGSYGFSGVPANRTYTLRTSYFGLEGYQCCSYSIDVGDPSSGIYDVGQTSCVRGSC